MNRQLFARAWMLLLSAILAIPLSAQQLTVQVDNEGGLWDALEAQGVTNFAGIKQLKVTGVLGSADFQLIKNQMSNIESIDISGTNVTEIPNRTFSNKSNLKLVRLPEDVTIIRYDAFNSCEILESITFGNQSVTAGKIKFPVTLRYIEYSAFLSCKLLTHIDFSACTNLEYIGSSAFENLPNLKELLLPSIGNIRFDWNCFNIGQIWDETNQQWIYKGLEELTLTKAITSMDGYCLPRSLKTLFVESSTPPSCNNEVFSPFLENGTTSLKIYIPKGSKRNYAIADGWSKIYQYMEEMGIKLNISGYGTLQKDNNTYSDGDVFFTTQGSSTTLKAEPEIGCELISVKLDGNDLTVATDGTISIPVGTTVGTLDVTFTANPITIDNPNGGELKNKIIALGITPGTLRTLKITGKLNAKDWNFVTNSLSSLEVFDISETNVTSIPESVLRERQFLTTVHLPSTVTVINRYAFYNCQQLTTVDGCENVEEIRERGFAYCAKLADFPFGNKIRSIESGVFENCASLPEALIMPSSLTTLGWDNVFNGSSIRTFDLSQCTLTSNIGNNAFGECTSLTLPEKGDYSLSCSALSNAHLTELRIPAAVRNLDCDNILPQMLERLYVSRTVPIDANSSALNNIDFGVCTLYVPTGSIEAYSEANGWQNFVDIKEYGIKVIINGFGSLQQGYRTFANGEALFTQSNASMLKAVPEMGNEIVSVTLDDNTLAIGNDGTFTIPTENDLGTLHITFTANPITIDNPNGSELKTKITGFNIEPSAIHALKVTGKLTSKDWNFVSSSLQMIELFDISETNITSIPESALRERQYLTTVHLPSTVTNIGSYAFYNCQQLTTVDGCDNVEEIGDRAFSNCTQLANFPFGNKLRSLSSGVFENCSSLPETLVMPASLNYMWYDNIFNGSSVRSFDLSQCTLNQSLQHNLFGKCTSLLLPENGNYQLNEYALSEALLTELRLPAAVSGINCDHVLPATLQRLYVTHTEPIYVSDNNAFTNIDYKLCTLYVPVGTKAAYSETNGWSEFTIIKECGFIIRTDSLGILKYEGKDYHDGDAFIPSQEGSITMQIIPSFGYEIATLKIDGIALDYADDGTFTIPSTIIGGRIEVTFAKKQLEIAVTMEGNGSYTIDGQSYTSSSTLITNGGDVLKLHLQPATGNFVKQVTIDGKNQILKNGGLEFATDTIGANTAISIVFSNDVNSVATITFEQEGGGNVSYKNETFEDGSTLTIAKNQDITLKITPTGDFNFQSLSVNGIDVTTNVNDSSYTLNNISANTIVKTFFSSPNEIAVENPNGGELKDLIVAMGSTPSTLRTLKVIGKLTNKDWNFVMSSLSELEVFDISETDVKTIPESAFQNKYNLTTVHLPSTVVTIGNSAFASCYQLTTIDGYDNVSEIGSSAFSWCSKLTNFPFGNKIRSIESDAFRGCSSLPEKLKMPASLNTLGWSSIFDGSSIRDFDLSLCTLTGSYAYNMFGECTSLTLPENGSYTLSCDALRNAQITELRLPSAVRSLDCSNVLPTILERLYVSSAEPIEVSSKDALSNIDFDNCILYVPIGSADAYDEANVWSSFTKIKEYGFKVKTDAHGTVKYAGKNYKDGEFFFPPQGDVLTLQIVSLPGYDLATLKVNGTAFDFADDGTFTIPATITGGTIEATFTNKQLEVAISMEGSGSYTIGEQTYTATTTLPVNGGDMIKIQLQPATGNFVKQVTIDGQEVALKNGGFEVTTAALDANTTIAIVFSNDATSITTVAFQQDGFGIVSCGGTTFEDGSTLTLVKGKNVTLSFAPYGDSDFKSLFINDVDVADNVSDNAYTLTNVSANTTVKTTFFSPNMVTVDNPNGGELKDMLAAMGCTPSTLRVLKVTGKMATKDWNYVKSNMPQLEEFDISETDVKFVPEDVLSNREKLTTVHLPSTVSIIYNSAFKNCPNLTTIDGCKSVLEIGNEAFGYCYKLSQFPFGNKIKKIESYAFNECRSLPETLVMPASLNSLGWGYVFSNSSVTSFDLSQCTLTGYIGDNTFGECTFLVLPENGDYYFSCNALRNARLTELRLPAAVSGLSCENVLPTLLERLYVSRTEPLSWVDNNSLKNLDFDNCTLYVPQGSKEAYAADEHWSNFADIKEFGMLVTVGDQGKVRAGTQTMMGTTAFFPITSSVTFEIVPNAGWHADAVTVNGTNVPFANNQFTLSGDQLSGKVAVSFAINQFNLQLQIAGDGKVKLGSLEYTSNQSLSVDSLAKLNFTLEPAEGLAVSNITFNGKESVVQNGGTNYVTPAITANSTLAVTFGGSGATGNVATYTVNTSENGTVEYLNTSLLPQTTILVRKDVDAVFTLKPDDHCILDKVMLDGNDVTDQVDANGQLIVKKVSADATLEVTFVMNTQIVIALEEGMRLNNALTDEQKQKVTKLTVSGQLWEEDYYTMRDKMPQLAEIDLYGATSEWIPSQAFCVTQNWDTSVGKQSLTSIRLPEGTRSIGWFAFAGCSNLKEVNFTELKKLENMDTYAFGWTALNIIDMSHTKLTRIDDQFHKVKGLENVKLPKGVDYLGGVFRESNLTEIDLSDCTKLKTLESTFQSCKKLEKVILPDSITSINYAFSNCEVLSTINLPKSLQAIGNDAFCNTKLQTVDLSNHTNLVSIGWGAFRDCQALKEVQLPVSLQSLSNSVFSNSSITSIDLSKLQMRDIPEGLFSDCRQLESVKLPKDLKTIGNSAFYGCEKLAGMIELPATITSIGDGAFWGTQISVVKCDATTPPTITNYSITDKWEIAFVPEGCYDVYKNTEIWEDKTILDKEVHADVTVYFEGDLMKEISMQMGISPATITHLKVHGPLNALDFANMRSNMTLLYDLDLEDAECTIIPEGAFQNKKVLMNIKLPRELMVIQEYAFQGCSSLKGTLTLPKGVTTIGWAAFQGCSSLEKIEFSSALEVIRGYAFEGCTSLQQEITFPERFTSIGEYAFANCRNLTGTVKFNNDFYMFMGNEGYWSDTGYTFENCSKIETVDMSECEYLDQLPWGVFRGCTSLHTMKLPPYLERIEGNGFDGDTNLRNIEFPSSLMYIDDNVFYNCTSLKRVDLSECENFATIGYNAFANCSSLEAVSLPASLNWIQSYAFSGCRKLTELNVDALQPSDLGEYVFRRVRTDRCVLSIPTGTFYDYLSAPQWGEFVTMRKAIDVTLDEGASLSYSSGGEDVASARRAHRAPAAESQQGNVNVKDGSSLYVAENENVTFYINPDENVSIKQVLFNGEDVTGQLQANAFVTPSLTDNASFKVLLNVDGPITVKELRMLNQNMNIKVAESAKITATVYPTNATNKTVIWTSSNEDVATVTNEGLVTGVNAGRAIITAKTEDGNFEQKCELVVMSNDYYITLAKENNAFVENTCMLPIMLHNADAAQGIQFDVYLPEGLGMDYDWSESFGVELSSRSQGHRVTAARRQDGSVRVIVYSLNGQPFSGNDGELLTLPISTREEVGDYKVEIKNIHISGPNSFNFTAPDYATNIRVGDYPLGDSNGNGEVSVFDATNTVDQILERYTDRFIRKAADVNHDGIITVSDVTGTIDIILERPMASRATHRAASDTDDKVFIDDFKLTNGQQQTISLQLTNTELYTAFQCDIVLPEGLTVAEDDDNMPMVSICGANANNHIVQTNYVSNGALRLLVMSMNNSPFKANVNNVVNLTLEANAAIPGQKVINIDNVRLVNAESRLETVAASTQATVDIVEETTNINSMAGLKVSINNHVITVIANADTTLRLVSVDGKQRVLTVKAGTNSFFIPQSGIYMLQGRKIVIK